MAQFEPGAKRIVQLAAHAASAHRWCQQRRCLHSEVANQLTRVGAGLGKRPSTAGADLTASYRFSILSIDNKADHVYCLSIFFISIIGEHGPQGARHRARPDRDDLPRERLADRPTAPSRCEITRRA